MYNSNEIAREINLHNRYSKVIKIDKNVSLRKYKFIHKFKT